MHIALFQMDTIWHDKKKNLDKIANAAKVAKASDAEVLCVPEMCSTGFTMDAKEVGESFSASPTLNELSKIAKANSISLISSIVENDKAKFFNTAFVIDQKGKLITKYRKMHLFPLSKEDENYSAGNKIETFTLNNVKFGIAICYDLRFPELFRKLMEKDVEVVVIPSNWPSSRKEHWLTLLQARAIENQFFVAGVNRTGKDPYAEYTGDSIVFGPWGETVVNTESGEQLIITDLNISKLKKIREEYPFLKSIKLL